MSPLTFTNTRMTVRVRRTIVIHRAHGIPQPAANRPIQRIAIESTATAAQAHMILGHALRVPSAHRILAHVLALGLTQHRDARRIRRTVRIVHALHGRPAALVVRIADQTVLAAALEHTVRRRTAGARTARRLAARVDRLAVLARIAREAGLAMAHLPVILGSAQRIRSARLAQQTGQPAHVAVAQLVRRALLVLFALDRFAAHPAGGRGIAGKAGPTRAHRLVVSSGAFGVAAAQHARLASVAALRPPVRILFAALRRSAFVVRPASHLLHADAVLAELELGARRIRLARGLADALQTDLVADTVPVGGAQRTADARIADGPRLALLIVAAVLNGHTAQQRIAGRLRVARADADVILHRAVGVATAAVLQRARVHATGVHARQIHGAVIVVGTLDQFAQRVRIAARVRRTRAPHFVRVHRALGVLAADLGSARARIRAAVLLAGGGQRTVRVRGTLVRIAAATLEGVADQAVGTGAHERAGRVLAASGRMAGILLALVDVLADARLLVIALQAGADGLVVGHMADAAGAANLVAGVC